MPATYSRVPTQAPNEEFSFGTAFAFSINFAMGAGFLSLPWAFYQSGVVLGVIMMIFIAIPLAISIPYNLEAMARADAVFRLRRRNDSFLGEKDPLIHESDLNGDSSSTGVNLMSNGNLIVRRDKFELYELCELFVGNTTKFLFIACLAFYTYGCLWAFGSVFGSAMSATLPLSSSSENITYWVYLTVFAGIVIPLTCMELNEQIYTQVFLAFCRLLVAALIVGTAAHAYLTDDAILNHAKDAPMVDWTGVTVILPIAAYAFAFTQSMPALSEPVANKSQLATIFQCTVCVCLVGYVLIGAGVVLAFGSAVQSSCNLNWMDYTAGAAKGEPVSLLVDAIRLYVVMFPALDVMSAFPLMAITLGNNLFSCVYGHTSKKMSRKYTVMFRLIAAIPPLLGASAVSNLGVITDYTGIAGCILAFIFPPLLANRSELYFTSRAWNPHTVYSGILTSTVFRNLIFWFSAVLVVVVTLSNTVLKL